jgi:aminopeptidase YwaD
MTSKSSAKFNLRTVLAGLTLGLTLIVTLSAWTLDLTAQVPSATDEILRHAKYLASDELTGRGVDTPGISLARDYIASEFAKYGLRPGGDGANYLQSFDVAVGVMMKEPSSLVLGQATLAVNEDWIPLGLSTSDKAEAEVVFAGYGITAKDYGYDDYADVDVKGKIALVLRYEPPPKDDKSPFRKLPDSSTHAALRTKANNARDHGAAGMILVDLNHTGDEKTELISTRNSLWRGGNSLVAAQVKRRLIEKWLNSQGVSLTALKEKIDQGGKPASMPVRGATLQLQVSLQEVHRRAENVVAVLPGTDPILKKENIVIGAHYDHLGLGHFGALARESEGRIHPGADDNASGTAVLLDLARRLSALPAKPARTFLFVAFSAEELGLYGSRHFVTHASFLSSTKAMINLDMVGRLRENRVTVFGARSGESFSNLISETAGELGLAIVQSDNVGRSDHMSFYNRKIPVLHFFTGNHADYHRPTDTWEKLNIEGMAKVSDLVLLSALRIDDSKAAPAFVSLPSRPSTNGPGERPGFSTYLGSIPDYGANIDGVRLAGVTDGSPAARAGLKEGDIIIQLADKKIQNIEDLTAALRGQKPGDEVAIVVLRTGKPVSVKAILRARG